MQAVQQFKLAEHRISLREQDTLPSPFLAALAYVKNQRELINIASAKKAAADATKRQGFKR
jgi:hypothetical protein